MPDFPHKELTYTIIGAAMEVHNTLGPGFLEEVYQKSLETELRLRQLPYDPQHRVVVRYKGFVVADYFLDLVVDNKVILELKAVDRLASLHEAQLIAYLKASELEVGLLLNFGAESLQHRRLVLTDK